MAKSPGPAVAVRRAARGPGPAERSLAERSLAERGLAERGLAELPLLAPEPRQDAAPMPLLPWAAHVVGRNGHAPARHHRMLLDRLGRLGEGSIDRLMVLMPPGSAKSTYASLVFPAWWLARHPTSSVIAASHTAELAEHFGRQLRNLVAEDAAMLGYGLSGDNRAAHRFRTTSGGEYFATGIHGPVTGRRADLVVIDDPIKSHAEGDSELARTHLWNWYRSELITRLKPGGRIVLVMTRWHEDDLGGRLLESGDKWHLLRLPALAEAGDPLGRAPGAALWPEWENATDLARKRLTVGSRVWQSLYQQAPAPDEGVLFPVARIGFAEAVPEDFRMIRAWDLAATEAGAGSDPDWTVGMKLASGADGSVIVVDVIRFRGGPHEVAETILRTAQRDGTAVPVGLPQDPGQAGKQQVAWLSRELAGYTVLASPETGAKLTRALPVAALVEAGRMRLLRAGWNQPLLNELRDFPHGRKDDQVDALSRGFAMIGQGGRPARRMNVALLAR